MVSFLCFLFAPPYVDMAYKCPLAVLLASRPIKRLVAGACMLVTEKDDTSKAKLREINRKTAKRSKADIM